MSLKKKRAVGFLLIAVLLVSILLIALTENMVFFWLSAFVLGAYGAFALFFWRCPWCGKSLGRLEKQKFCLHCGRELDM